MVSTEYLKIVLDNSKIGQVELADEWAKTARKNKYQTGVSAELKKEYTDSISFIKAISNLSKLPIADLLMELTFDKKSSRVVYTAPAMEQEMIPVSNSLRAAASSLLSVVNEPGEVEEADFISVPKSFSKPGVKMVIRVTGQSMTGSIEQDDYVACRLLEQYDWMNIKDDYVYVIVTKSNETHIKRVKNRLKDHGILVCKSDNTDKKEYPDFNVEYGEIAQVWEVIFSLSWKFPDPHAGVKDKIQELEAKQFDQEFKIKQLFEEMRLLRA